MARTRRRAVSKDFRSKREKQFYLVLSQLAAGSTAKDVYLCAAFSSDPQVTIEKALDDCKRHLKEREKTGTFSAPKYVHKFIEERLNLKPKPVRPKKPKRRQRPRRVPKRYVNFGNEARA